MLQVNMIAHEYVIYFHSEVFVHDFDQKLMFHNESESASDFNIDKVDPDEE